MKFRRLLILILRFLNADPLSKDKKDLPIMDVIIPSAPKDLNMLEQVIKNLRLNCRNPISKIYVVTPNKLEINFNLPSDVIVYSDDEFLDLDLELFKLENPELYGWCVQQLIKIKGVSVSKEKYLLWLDSDTLLNEVRTFVDNKFVLEIISDEFHAPYFRGLEKTLSLKSNVCRLSRVSHHAVIDVNVFRSFEIERKLTNEFDWKKIILGSVDASMRNSSANWFIFGKSSFSEYEMNSLILKEYNVPRKLASWWNESRNSYSTLTTFEEVEDGKLERLSACKRPAKPYSISFHSWKTNKK